MSGFADKAKRLQSRALSSSFFGEDVTHRPKPIGAEQTIKMIFFEDFEAIDLENTKVLTTQPNGEVRLADFTVGPVENDEFVIRGKEYRVISIEPDGLGMATVFLHFFTRRT